MGDFAMLVGEFVIGGAILAGVLWAWSHAEERAAWLTDGIMFIGGVLLTLFIVALVVGAIMEA